jgi:hypothetical protein
MKLGTKFKHILLMFDLNFTMDEDMWLTVTVIDKMNKETIQFSGANQSILITKSYSYFKKVLKEKEKLWKFRRLL